MHILIVEAALTGHHTNYLEHIAATFLAHGHRLTISVQDGYADDPLLIRLQMDHPQRVAIKTLPSINSWAKFLGKLGVVGSELRQWLIFKRICRQVCNEDRMDHVFFPYVDYCLHAAALLGSPSGLVGWSGICMRPSFHYGKVGVIAPKPRWSLIKERLFYRLLQQSNLQKLLTIDELLEQHTRHQQPEGARKLAFVPDPAELTNHLDRSAARTRLGISDSDFIVLVYGAIDGRKGVENLLRGIRNQQYHKNLKVLVMGRQHPAIREKLAQDKLVISVDQYVDSETEEAGFRAADAVWMGYSAHYSMSGVLVLAAFAGKPVIATRTGLIGWMTLRYNLGVVVDCEDTDAVSRAVATLKVQRVDQPSEGMLELQHRHTWRAFNESVLRSLTN